MKKKKDTRRSFIHKMGIGAASLIGVSSMNSNGAFGHPGKETTITSDDVFLGKDVQIGMQSSGNNFLGIGTVRVGGTVLRDQLLPLCCEIRSPEGIQVVEYPILQKNISSEKIELKLGARTKKMPVMEYMLHSVRCRENLYGWSEGLQERAGTFVTITLLPVSRMVGNRLYKGFSYQYRFESQDFQLFKLIDRATWEIGGHAVGNECWMRVGHVPSIVPFDRLEQRYSTENYYHGIANPNVFQFLPLQTELQGFTFQAHQSGILVTWPTEIAHVRTLLEKPAGQDRVFHFHQHCQDLSGILETSPVEVLWLAVPDTSRVDRYNIFEAVRVMVHDHLHTKAGIRPERVSPYGMIEEWDEPDFDKYTDVILPKFIDKGVKRLFLPNEFQNNMNTWGLSNMCCNVDFKFSETAGPEKIRRFCAKAIAAGILVDMWGNTAISTLTDMFLRKDGKEKGIHFQPEKGSVMEVLRKSKDPYVRNPSNAIEADHYTPVFAVLNLRDPDIRAYWIQQWKIAYDTGIHGIFLDSSFNMSSDKFHFIQNTDRNQIDEKDRTDTQRFYRPVKPAPSAILTQYHAHLELIRQMQEVGYSYCGEDLGVFGVHRHGPDLDMFWDCMPLFPESFMDFDSRLAIRLGQDPLALFFKGLAYRVMWMLRWDFGQERVSLGIEDERAFAFFKAFSEVNRFMHRREILPGESAVKYESADETGTIVYWVFQPFTIHLEKKQEVWDVMKQRTSRMQRIQAAPFSIYVVKG